MALPSINPGSNLFTRRDDDLLDQDGDVTDRGDAQGRAGETAPLDSLRDALLSLTQGSKDGAQALTRLFGNQHNSLADEFRVLGQAVSTLNARSSAQSPEEKVKSAFKEEFAAKAANKEEFDAFMQQVYGDKYDKNLAEQYRQQALRGDFPERVDQSRRNHNLGFQGDREIVFES